MANIGLCAVLTVTLIVLIANQGSRAERCPIWSPKIVYPPSCPRSGDSRFATVCCTRKDSYGTPVGTCCEASTCHNRISGTTYHCPKSGGSKDKSICCTQTINGKKTYTCCGVEDLQWYIWVIVGGVAFVIFLLVTCLVCCCCSCCCLAQRRQARGGYVIVQ